MKMTPLKIEILLHYYSKSGDYPNLDAPAVAMAIEELCTEGILYKRLEFNSEKERKIGFTQDALAVYITELLSIPLPKQVWVIPEKCV